MNSLFIYKCILLHLLSQRINNNKTAIIYNFFAYDILIVNRFFILLSPLFLIYLIHTRLCLIDEPVCAHISIFTFLVLKKTAIIFIESVVLFFVPFVHLFLVSLSHSYSVV